jgi:hypothetical protein
MSKYSDELRAGRLRLDSRKGQHIFSSPQRQDRFGGPPGLLSIGYRGLFPRVKRPGREANRSPPNSEFKNGGANSPLLHTSS